ncbi:MAG: helix-turn-helix domain-containing protein [Planctomycetota bacterium]
MNDGVQPAGVPAVARAIRVLEAVREGPAGSVQQVARAAGVAVTSCFRILNTLEQHRWVARTGTRSGGYSLSVGLLPYVEAFRPYDELRAAARPALDQLAASLGLSVKLSVRVGWEAMTLARAEPPDGMVVASASGARFAVVLGATGGALLSLLDDAEVEAAIEAGPASAFAHQSPGDVRQRVEACRAEGACMDSGSYRPGIGGCAAPVPGWPGIEAAVSVVGLASDLASIDAAALRRDVCAAAERIAAEAGTTAS